MRLLSIVFLGSMFMPSLAVAAAGNSDSLYFSQPKTEYAVGDVFAVQLMVNTRGQEVNAVGAYVDYSEDVLEVLSVDTSASPLRFVIERNYGAGKIEVSGGTPTPGFRGAYELATVRFWAVKPGTATLSFSADSAVLTDKENANLFAGGSGAVVRIREGMDVSRESLGTNKAVYRSPMETFFACLSSFFRGMF